jgi:hypothetical protein
MTNPYRAMCAELLADYDNRHYRSELSDRARALLAQPEPEGLTEQELWQIWDDIDTTIPDILRAAIAADRARRFTPQPLPEAQP